MVVEFKGLPSVLGIGLLFGIIDALLFLAFDYFELGGGGIVELSMFGSMVGTCLLFEMKEGKIKPRELFLLAFMATTSAMPLIKWRGLLSELLPFLLSNIFDLRLYFFIYPIFAAYIHDVGGEFYFSVQSFIVS